MAKPLNHSHPVPDVVLEQDIAILGQKGAGKSITAKGLVERILAMQRRVIVLDPLSHWYGLRGRPDGSPGFPIVVIGGQHADIPLDKLGGARFGEVLAESDHSFVVDVSDLPKSELIAFTTAFLNALYVHNRRALWLVAEEADIFAPQNPAMDGTRAMLDAMDLIARRGRQRGFRLWTVTQRPARIAKDVLSMASALMLMRIRGPQDRGAAEDWVKGHATKEQTAQLVNGLAGLEVGQGFVYAPDLDLLEKVRFPMIETLDTSSTPKAGDAPRQIGEMAKVDVEAIRAALRPIPPPTSDGAAKSAAAPQPPTGLDVEAIRREAKSMGHREGYERGFAAAVAQERSAMRGMLEPIMASLASAPTTAPTPPVEEPPKAAAAPPPKRTRAPPADGDIGPAGRKLLAAIQRYCDTGLTWNEACVVAGLVPGNGYFYGGRKALQDAGLVDDRGGRIFMRFPRGAPAHLTRAEFLALWSGRKAPGPKLLAILANARGQWVDLETLANQAGLKPGNGFWYGGLSTLRDANLIEQDKVRARVCSLIAAAAP